MVVTRIVSTGYFETVGTELIAGRRFQATDTQKAPPVAIISQAMARYYFKDQSPDRPAAGVADGSTQLVAARLKLSASPPTRHADGLTERPEDDAVSARHAGESAVSTLLVRTAGSTEQLTPRVVETIRSLDPNRPVDHVQTLEEIRDETIAPQRLNATLIGLFALLALAIAMVGVGGVLAFSVSQRTNELGIRMALGAEPGSILRMILGEGAMMAAIGLVIGGLARRRCRAC